MTAPVTAPETDRAAAARAAVRARWSARQDEQSARQAARDEERAIRDARRAGRREVRRMSREDRADRAAGMAGAAGGWARRAAPVVGAAVPVAMVNATAFVGQFAYIRDHVPWVLPGQVLVAATFESVAVYLAWYAHMAQMKNDSATRLKLGAQLFALIMAGMNYSHYAVHWHPTVLAVGLGLMSLLSPSLWGIYSRRAARDKLMERGLIEEHAVRLGANRWTWHPVRSVAVMWRATWVGENDPKSAIGLYEAAQASRRATRSARRKPRQDERAVTPRQGGAPALAAPEVPAPRQAAIEDGAPVAQGELFHWPATAGLIPGTTLNGHQVADVKAIAQMAARPTLSASHKIDPQRVVEAELHLAGIRADELPSERAVSSMLCPGHPFPDHDHRRQAKALIKARRAAGQDPLPAFTQRQRPAGAPTAIATPAANLPGGIQAHG
jgi:hypothetical protein